MIYCLTIPGQRIEVIYASSASEWLQVMREGSLMESNLTNNEYLISYCKRLDSYLGSATYRQITSADELVTQLSADGFLTIMMNG